MLDLAPSKIGLDHWHFGVLQGRLLTKVLGSYQAFPRDSWQHEFRVAPALGIRHIEFIVDSFGATSNPILSLQGARQVKNCADNFGVRVVSICADSLMDSPLYVQASETENIFHLHAIADACQILEVDTLVVPFVDRSSIRTEADEFALLSFLEKIEPHFLHRRIKIALETDLPPEKFEALLSRANPELVTVNYDIGNSSSMGYDPIEEFQCYGDRISNVHIKDRLLMGGSVPLGTGAAKLSLVFYLLRKYQFSGIPIAQAWRGNWGALDTVPQLWWLKQQLKSCGPFSLDF